VDGCGVVVVGVVLVVVGVVVVVVVVVGVVVVVVGVLLVVVGVVVVVVVGGLADPPITVAIGAHQWANPSPQVTTTSPALTSLLCPPRLVDMIDPDALIVAHRRTNPVV
jgi:hypothetical protein